MANDTLTAGTDEEEDRRRAFLSRMGNPGGTGSSFDEGTVLDKTSPAPTSSAGGSVLDAASPQSGASRPSVLEQTEMGGRSAANDEAQRFLAGFNARQQREGGAPTPPKPPTPPSDNPFEPGNKFESDSSGYKQYGAPVVGGIGRISDFLFGPKGLLPNDPSNPINAIGPTGALAGPVNGIGTVLGKAGGAVSDLAGAIGQRIGGRLPSAIDNAAALGESGAARVGGAITGEGDSALAQAIKARRLPTAAENALGDYGATGRRIGGAVEDAAAADARARAFVPGAELPGGPSFGTAAKVIGAGAAAGLGSGLTLAGGGGDQGTNQPGSEEQPGVGGQGQGFPTPTPPVSATPPTVQTPQPTPPTTTTPVVPPTTYVPPRPPVVPPSGPAAPVTPPPAKPPVTPPPTGRPPTSPVGPGTPPPGQPPTTPPPGLPTGPVTGPIAQGPINSQAIRQQVIADLNGIAQQLNAGAQTPQVQAIFAVQAQTILDMLSKQIADAQAEGINDPATQNALSTIREELERQLKATRETLNSRGLLDSGILVEAEQMLRKGNLNDQQKIISDKLSRIAQNVQQLRGQQASTAQTFGLAGAQAQTQAEEAERNRMQTLRTQLINGRLGLANHLGDEENAQANRDFSAQENDLNRQAAFANLQYQLAVKARDDAAAREWQARENELNRQAQDLRNQQTNSTRNTSQAEIDLATNNVIAQLGSADYATALAAAQAAQGQAGFENVDWLKVMQAVNAKQSTGFKFPWE